MTDTIHDVNEMKIGDTICLNNKVYTKVKSKLCIGVTCFKEDANIEVLNDSSN